MANLTPDPYAWKWSSAKAHADGADDILVKVSNFGNLPIKPFAFE